MSIVLLGRLLQEIIVPGNRFPFAERETKRKKILDIVVLRHKVQMKFSSDRRKEEVIW